MISVYDQMFDFVYYSKGAFSHTEVMNWPIGLRNYYVGKLVKILEEQAEQAKRAAARRR